MGLFDIFKKKKQTEEVDIHLLQQKMYQDIFSKVQTTLPKNWKKVDLHVYHTSGSFGIKYYVMTENNEWIDCFKFLDKKLRTKLFLSIDEDIANVWNQLPKKHKWYVLNMVVDNQGHIDISYDYADGVRDNQEKLFTYLYNEEKEWNKKFENKAGYHFNITITNPIQEEEFNKIERANNIKFPKKLRDYWLTYGDSPIKRCVFGGREYLTDLAAICFPTDLILKLGRENGWLPKTFYPIAHDSGGNYYCWNADDNKIYLMFNDDVDNPFVFCNSVEELFKLMDNCKHNN